MPVLHITLLFNFSFDIEGKKNTIKEIFLAYKSIYAMRDLNPSIALNAIHFI
jgi:hypothetical protein